MSELIQVELVEALRTNNVDAILAAILKLTLAPDQDQVSFGSPLHLVISLSTIQIVEQVLLVFCKLGEPSTQEKTLAWCNVQNCDGETALHIASKLARYQLIDILFTIPCIDDTLRDCNGQTAEESAPNERMADLFNS